jgi:phage tail-like protein
MATGDRKDPHRVYNFRLEIDGIDRGGFRECSGLDSTQDPIEYREGNEKPLTVRKQPGLVKYSNITLKWGIITDDPQWWDWRTKTTKGELERKNLSIVLLDDTAVEVYRWNLRDAWPAKWTGASFNSTGNEIAIETLELAHEGVEARE